MKHNQGQIHTKIALRTTQLSKEGHAEYVHLFKDDLCKCLREEQHCRPPHAAWTATYQRKGLGETLHADVKRSSCWRPPLYTPPRGKNRGRGAGKTPCSGLEDRSVCLSFRLQGIRDWETRLKMLCNFISKLASMRSGFHHYYFLHSF